MSSALDQSDRIPGTSLQPIGGVGASAHSVLVGPRGNQLLVTSEILQAPPSASASPSTRRGNRGENMEISAPNRS